MDYEYDETAELGRGGMAVVYIARKRGSGDEVVLKRPLPYPGVDADKRLKREIKALNAVDHPNVIRVIEDGVDEAGEPWYIMPRASWSLKSYWEDHPSPCEAEVLCEEVLEDICAGLGAMHDAGFVHRDVTPSNILGFPDSTRRSGFRWVVADCGLARPPLGETTTALTGSASHMGTDGYIAPETFGDPHSAPQEAADVYSLGRIFASLLTGKKPQLIADLLPDDGPWRQVVRAFTYYEPARRPQTMTAALARAQALLTPLPTSVKADFREQIANNGGDLIADNPLWQVVDDHLQDLDFMIDDLPTISRRAARRLAEAKPEAAAKVAEALANHLSNGEWWQGRNFNKANGALDWLRAVLVGLVDADRLDLFGDLAPEYCEAVKSCDRYDHNDRMAAWLAGLNGPAGTAMARAIRQAGATDYIRQVMNGRVPASPTIAALLEAG